jgi:hypothetical protein
MFRQKPHHALVSADVSTYRAQTQVYDELKTERGIELSLDQMDDIIEKVLQVAKHRSYK